MSYIRKGLNTRIADELKARAARGDLEWSLESTDRLMYVVKPGRAWADREAMSTLRMTPGETAEWLGLKTEATQ